MSATIVLALRLLLALALYGFLGWGLFVLWREIQYQGKILSSRQTPEITLVLYQGSGTDTIMRFSQPEIILGREPGCDICLPDETVSSRHAQLGYHHNQWWLSDLSSTNGTILNGIPVNTPTVITSGDEIRCGNNRLYVTFSPDAQISPKGRLGKTND